MPVVCLIFTNLLSRILYKMGLVLAHCNKASPQPSKLDPESDTNQTSGTSNKHAGQGVRRPKYAIADLPFQPCSTEAIHQRRTLWRLQFVPSLLDWAGSCFDPFGTNSQMEETVTSIWKCVFPQIALNKEGTEIVLHVVCTPSPTILYSARGAMGRSNACPPV